MVRQLGIAKGSVYQYFDDKRDLFEHLIAQATARKVAWFESLPIDDATDLFARLRTAYGLGLRFWRSDPVSSRLLLRLLEPSTDPALTRLRATHTEGAHAWLEATLRQGQADGVVRADLDPALTAPLVHGLLSDGLLASFLAALGTDLDGLVADPDRFDDAALHRALQAADAAVDLLARGVARAG